MDRSDPGLFRDALAEGAISGYGRSPTG